MGYLKAIYVDIKGSMLFGSREKDSETPGPI